MKTPTVYLCPRNGESVDCTVCEDRVVPDRVESLTKGKCPTHEIQLVKERSIR